MNLRGNDHRLVRLDATDDTKKQQKYECRKDTFDSIVSYLIEQDTASAQIPTISDRSIVETITKVGDYITLCVVDNPMQNIMFSELKGIHGAVISLMGKLFTKSDTNGTLTIWQSYALAQLAHVVYVTSSANRINHQAYLSHGVTTQLANVIKGTIGRRRLNDDDDREELDMPHPLLTMWSCAALGNIMASYCDKSSDGKCYWVWYDNNEHMAIAEDLLPIMSDGAEARNTIIQDDILIEYLLDLSCIRHAMYEDAIMVGSTATINRDEGLASIVPWSSTYALFQLAVHPSYRHKHYVQELSSFTCLCQLCRSYDWLEEEKSFHLLERTRRSYPCYFRDEFTQGDENEESNFIGQSLCINHEYYYRNDHTNSSMTCNHFLQQEEPPTDQQCAQVDRFGHSATESCCICGGGEIVYDPSVQNMESDVYDEEQEEL